MTRERAIQEVVHETKEHIAYNHKFKIETVEQIVINTGRIIKVYKLYIDDENLGIFETYSDTLMCITAIGHILEKGA